MNNFMKAIDILTKIINGSDNRGGKDRRKNKQRKRKNERRISQRRKWFWIPCCQLPKKCALKKEQGEFKTYRDAYRWAITNISSLQVQSLTVQILERAYYKANSKGRRGLKKVSIPIMITNKMRIDLLMLGYSKDEMKHLTPQECWQIIEKGVPKKPSKERGRNQWLFNCFCLDLNQWKMHQRPI